MEGIRCHFIKWLINYLSQVARRRNTAVIKT